MGRGAWDYSGYRRFWLLKSECTPKFLNKYGVKASQKEINKALYDADDGSIAVGGMGHVRHVRTYNIKRLCDHILNQQKDDKRK